VSVTSVSVPSGVPDQPMGDEQTRQGALNRACNASNLPSGPGQAADFFVGLEGGCVFEAPVEIPSSQSAPARPQQLSCFAWGIVVKRGSSVVGAARTASFQLPDCVAQLVAQVRSSLPLLSKRVMSHHFVLQGVEIGVADDQVFGRVDSKRQGGSVGLLSGGLIDRAAYYEHAMILALVPFMDCNKTLY